MSTNPLRSPALLILLLVATLVAGPAVLTGAAVYGVTRWKALPGWPALAGGAGSLVLAFLMFQPAALYASAWGALADGSLVTGPLRMLPLTVPLGLLVGGGARELNRWRIRRGMRPAQQVREKTVADDRAKRKATKHVTAEASPKQTDGLGVLGGYVEGDLHLANPDWRRKQWLTVPEDLLGRHMVVLGETGAGKTETLLRLAWLARTVYGQAVYVIDAKGDTATGDRLTAATGVPMLRWPSEAVDLWRGDGRAVWNRLVAGLDYSEPYYRNVLEAVLQAACLHPSGPPRSPSQLLSRLDLEWIRGEWAGITPEEVGLPANPADLLARVRDGDIASARMRLGSLLAQGGHTLTGSRSWEDAPGVYVAVDGTALGAEAGAVARMLLTDFAHFAARRKPTDERALLIVDELSAVDDQAAPMIVGMFERLRSVGVGVVVSAQSVDGLGDEHTARRMLTAGTTRVYHTQSDPETLAERAGTTEKIETTVQMDEGWDGAKGTQGVGQAYRVAPDAIRQLKVGQAFVVHGGRAAQCAVARIPDGGAPPHSLNSFLPPNLQRQEAPDPEPAGDEADDQPRVGDPLGGF